MGFIMNGLDAEAYDRQYTDFALVKRIVRYFLPQGRRMIVILILVVLASVTNLAFPLLVSSGLDSIMVQRTHQSISMLVTIIFIAGLLSWGFYALSRRLIARAIGDVVLSLRIDAINAILARDMSFYDEFASGKIVSRVTSDSEEFSTVVTLTLNLVSQVLPCCLLIVILLLRSPYLSMVALTTVPIVMALALFFRRLARSTAQRMQRALASVNANVQEMVSGISVAKNFRQEQNTYDEFMRISEQSYQVSVRSAFIYGSIFPVLIFITNLGTSCVIFFGGRSVLTHTISIGNWFLFVQSIGFLWMPLTSIVSYWSQFQLGLAASERIFALLDAEPKVHQTMNEPVESLTGKIEFRKVLFSYDDRQTVLKNFDLTIQPGETVAIVGHTGAGKSSLAKLIARFYEYQGGELLIDGHDIRSFDLSSYHQHIGIVPQSPFLFSGTVAENIRYAHPTASDAEVEAMARNIGHGDWIDALPDGLQTLVSEAGHTLSMGQRQLIALARVLLQDPTILILDEATASVDPLTEMQIQEGLEVLLENRTALLIAHRLSTIQQADRIIVLDHGRIVEAGTHEALLTSGGHYAHIYNAYFRHQSLDYKPGEGFIAVKSELVSEDI